jgi:hypothetical protein
MVFYYVDNSLDNWRQADIYFIFLHFLFLFIVFEFILVVFFVTPLLCASIFIFFTF